jgi:hypothetical protein
MKNGWVATREVIIKTNKKKREIKTETEVEAGQGGGISTKT